MNDWRALVVNLIRDNLNSVFKLFVNDPNEYEGRYGPPVLPLFSLSRLPFRCVLFSVAAFFPLLFIVLPLSQAVLLIQFFLYRS